MGTVAHIHQGTQPRDLEEIKTEIYDTVDRMCFRVGELLHEARALNPAGYWDWVRAELPFSVETARRLEAIHLAYRELDSETKSKLPRAWQALFALREHAQSGRLSKAISEGEVGPETTVVQANEKRRHWSQPYRPPGPSPDRYSNADVLAGRLMEHPASSLNPHVLDALRRWLSR